MHRLLLFATFFVTIKAFSQSRGDILRNKLYRLQNNITNGNLSSLDSIAYYLDDTSFVQEYLGYHNYPNKARAVAMRILQENCLFLPQEYKLDSSATTASFLAFLKQNKVVFDDLSGTFLITALEKRNTIYQLKELSEDEIIQVNTDSLPFPYPDWYYENQLDGFLRNKDPQALLWIASAWFHRRSRFNVYYFQDKIFKNMIKRLTHMEVGAPDGNNKITFLYTDDYYAQAKLNFLIYWANHYREYTWNEQKGFFENSKEKPGSKSLEETLFPRLLSKDRKIALDAYARLTESDTAIVRQMSKAYDYVSSLDVNNALPLFAFRFLPKLAVLTRYCRDNGFSYALPLWVKDSLMLIDFYTPLSIKHRVENNIISRLTLQEITALEFYGLTGRDSDRATYSLGRILDKFYSKHLDELSADPRQLSLFLFKAKLFKELGIIGNCNKYLRKFELCKHAIIERVKQLGKTTHNADIKYECEAALALHAAYKFYQPAKPHMWEGYDLNYGVDDLKQKYDQSHQGFPTTDKWEWEVSRLIGDISYKQIGEALELLMKDAAIGRYKRFSFLESDFGIPVNAFKEESLQDFLALYSSLTEKQLYEHYLKSTGMHCFDSSGNLFFPGIYDILKYNVIDAFVGGGGGRKDEGVYLVIKMLEFQFNTTLGFAKKRCKSKGSYYCDCTEPAAAWMNYLVENKLVGAEVTEPLSISSNK